MLRLFNFVFFAWIIAQTFWFGSYGPDLGPISAIKPHRVLFIVVCLIFLLLKASGRTRPLRFEYPEYLMATLAIVCGISFIMSGAHFDRTVGPNKWLSALFNLTVYPYAAFFFVRAFPYQREYAKSVLKLFAVLGMYLAFTAFAEHYEWNSLIWPPYIADESRGTQFGRARGPFMESVAMGRMLTVAFGAWLVLRTESDRFKKMSWIFVPATMAGVYFTNTRGPWIGFGLLIMAFLLFKTPVRKTVAVLMIFIAFAGVAGVTNKFSIGGKNLFLDRQSTVTDRVVTWIVSAGMIKDHPVFGIGFGRFNHEWDKYFEQIKNAEFTSFDGSHNTLLTLAAEVGIPALIVFLAILYGMWRRCRAMLADLSSEFGFERSFVVMTIGLVWMYLFTGWFSDLRWNTVQNTALFTMLGILAALHAQVRQQAALPESSAIDYDADVTMAHPQLHDTLAAARP
jgi:O-antigen ligase